MNNEAVLRLRNWLETQNLERIFVYRPENFAWLTAGGDNTVVSGEWVGYIEIGRADILLHTSWIERLRFAEEEACGLPIKTHQWWDVPAIRNPSDLDHDLTSLRLILSEDEIKRFRALGSDAASALGSAVRSAKPDWTERALAGAIAEEMLGNGIQPIALLVAGDTRIQKYRHPLPKNHPLGKLCIAVVCGRREGLVINLTRMRSWDHPQASQLYEKVLTVEAAALDATCPGTSLGQVLVAILQAYAEIGGAEAFEQHHQGGIAGYRSREVLALPGDKTLLQQGMAVAWNPSLAGAKAEDTFLLAERGIENLTVDANWPSIDVNGRSRPLVLTS